MLDVPKHVEHRQRQHHGRENGPDQQAFPELVFVGELAGQRAYDRHAAAADAGDRHGTALRVVHGGGQVGGHVKHEQVHADGRTGHQADAQADAFEQLRVQRLPALLCRRGLVGFW
ncbi:hypothetical protein D3C79_863760 [compost metagenome]